MISLFRDSYLRAFLIGFAVTGLPMAFSTGLFS
jgi:hypothetical protein